MRHIALKAFLGDVRRMPMALLMLAGLSVGVAAQALRATDNAGVLEQLTGHWSGQLERGGGIAEFEMDLQQKNGIITGTFSWPDLGYRKADLIGVRFEGAEVRIAVPLPLGALKLIATPNAARLAGRLEETTLRAGEWVPLPADGRFVLLRSPSQNVPYAVTPVRFQSGTVTLSGEVYGPRKPGRHPGVVFVHGSGDSNRADGAFYADQFARAGIATLVYDKRGVGESSGQWRDGGYEELAQDAHAALETLRRVASINPNRVGYVARSEGGWVAPLAVRLGGSAFLGVISGPTVTVADEDVDSYRVALREAGLTEAQMAPAFDLIRLRHRFLQGLVSAQELERAVAAQKSKSWFPILHWEDAEDEASRTFRSRTIGYDPAPHLVGLSIPSFWLYGSDDVIIPAGDSVARLMSLHLQPRPTITVLPRADHALAVTDYPRLPGGVKRAAQLLTDWIEGL